MVDVIIIHFTFMIFNTSNCFLSVSNINTHCGIVSWKHIRNHRWFIFNPWIITLKSIADISHHQWLRTIFKPAYFLEKKSQNYGPFWIFSRLYVLFGVIFTGLNNAIAYQN